MHFFLSSDAAAEVRSCVRLMQSSKQRSHKRSRKRRASHPIHPTPTSAPPARPPSRTHFTRHPGADTALGVCAFAGAARGSEGYVREKGRTDQAGSHLGNNTGGRMKHHAMREQGRLRIPSSPYAIMHLGCEH